MGVIEAIGIVVILFLIDAVAQFIFMYFKNKAIQKEEDRLRDEYGAKLGRPVDSPDDDLELLRLRSKEIEERYSSRKLANRFANLFGFFSLSFGWLHVILKYGFLLYGGYMVAVDKMASSTLAIAFLVICILGSLVLLMITGLSRLLFGSRPGVPRLQIKNVEKLNKRIVELAQSLNEGAHRSPKEIPMWSESRND